MDTGLLNITTITVFCIVYVIWLLILVYLKTQATSPEFYSTRALAARLLMISSRLLSIMQNLVYGCLAATILALVAMHNRGIQFLSSLCGIFCCCISRFCCSDLEFSPSCIRGMLSLVGSPWPNMNPGPFQLCRLNRSWSDLL